MNTVAPASMSCLADTLAAAQSVVEGLMGAGFAADRISIVFAERGVAEDRFEAKYTGLPAGTEPGAAGQWLDGARRLVIAGCGAFVVGGPLGAALGADEVGMTERGIAEALARSGMAEARARQCERLVCAGSILIAAHGDDPDLADRVTRVASNAGVSAFETLPAAPTHGAFRTAEARPDPRERSGSPS